MRATTTVAASRTRRGWVQLVLLGALAGVVGGLVVGAVAGDRRGQSAAQRLVESTSAPDAYLFVRALDPERVAGIEEAVGGQLADDPDVTAVWPVTQFIGRTTGERDWYYPMAGPAGRGDIARPIVVEGRDVHDDAADEVVVTQQTADNSGLSVGDVIPMDLYTPAQMQTIAEDTESEPGGSHLQLRVVGIVRDSFDIAPAVADRMMVASPAFYEEYSGGEDNEFAGFAVRTADGDAGLARVVDRLGEVTGPGEIDVRDTASLLERIGPASRVLRIGIVLLALVVAAIGSFVLAQAIRRHVAGSAVEHVALRAIGFTRRDVIVSATLPGLVSAGVAAVVTIGVAVAVSPLFPFGHPRLLEPDPGLSIDLVAIVPGVLAVVAWTLALFVLMSWIDLERRPRPRRSEPSRLVAMASSVASPAVLLGLHLTGGPTRVRGGVRPRTAAAGAALGIAGLIAVTTFTASLDHLVDTPVEYGIDYDLSIEVPESVVDQRLDELDAMDELEAVALQRSATTLLNGREVEGFSTESTKGSIAPVLLEGRAPAGPDEITVGPALARDLGLEVGDTARLGQDDRSREVTVVGEALDAQAVSAGESTTLTAHPDTLADVSLSGTPFPILVVRYADGEDPAAVAAALDERYPFGVMDESFPHPPGALLNLDGVRAVPQLLALFFAGLSIVALVNGIVSGGRRARHDLGVVRGLGFTSGQVRTALAVMGLSLALGALVVGVPLGAIAGAASWSQVSSQLDIVPNVRWAFVVMGLVVLAVPVVGLLASLRPARAATRVPAGEVLRTE